MGAFATDPRITLQGLREPESPFEILSKFAQLKSITQGNQMRGMELADMQGQQAERAAIQRAIQAAGGDAEKALPEIMKVAPQTGLKFQKQIQEWKSADAEGKKKILDLRIAKSARLGQLAGGIRDQASYQAAIQQAVQEGVIDQEDAQSIPPQYDPSVVQGFQQSALTAQQQLEAARHEQDRQDKLAKEEADRKAPTATQKEFQEYYKTWLEAKGLPKNAKNEMAARDAFRQSLQAPRQPVPGTDVPLPADVEEQRKRMNAARAQVNGLSPQQLSKVNTLASQFDSNQVVQRFNLQVNHAASVKALLEGKWTGPGDMGIIYEFMKALDPTSVVRESEYAAASKTGNIFLGWAARFNGTLRPEGGFMSEQVKKDFAGVLEKKLDVSNKQVKVMHGDFARRINKITGGADGAEYLSDYSTLYGASGGGGAVQAFQVPAGAPTAPKEDGHKLKMNGQVVAVSKGGQWVAP